MAIQIITDSTSDIGREEAEKMGVTIVPLKVLFGEKEYREGIEITMDDFYQKLARAEKLPTTSQPAPDDFLGHFQKAKEVGDSVIVLLIAGKFSGTTQSAVIAKEIAEYDAIYIIDSLTAITGLRLLVEHAVKLREQHWEAEKIVAALEKSKDRIVLMAMVDTLEYLHKGGRLSKSSAVLGSLLRFKPILSVKDGVIGVVGKARGTNKGIARMLEIMEEMGEIDPAYPVTFGYTAEDSKGLLLKEKVTEKYNLGETAIYPVGCVVGTHVGPGACVITYIRK
ncbi:MAG: DegV family protein [Lachnospiraceae bacterium]|nr:DegV family protein [Lachnospiraceae bacterium]